MASSSNNGSSCIVFPTTSRTQPSSTSFVFAPARSKPPASRKAATLSPETLERHAAGALLYRQTTVEGFDRDLFLDGFVPLPTRKALDTDSLSSVRLSATTPTATRRSRRPSSSSSSSGENRAPRRKGSQSQLSPALSRPSTPSHGAAIVQAPTILVTQPAGVQSYQKVSLNELTNWLISADSSFGTGRAVEAARVVPPTTQRRRRAMALAMRKNRSSPDSSGTRTPPTLHEAKLSAEDIK